MESWLQIFAGIPIGFLVGFGGAWAFAWVRAWRSKRGVAARMSFDQAFPIINEWTERNEWYLESIELNQAAQMEHMRLMRDEPKLTLEENLEKVAVRVKQRYPEAFQTLH